MIEERREGNLKINKRLFFLNFQLTATQSVGGGSLCVYAYM